MTPKENMVQLALDYLGQLAFLESLNEARGADAAKLIRVGLRQLAYRTELGDLADLKEQHPHLEKIEVARLARMAEEQLTKMRRAAGLEEAPAEEAVLSEQEFNEAAGPYADILTAVGNEVDSRMNEIVEFVNAMSQEQEAIKDAVIALCEEEDENDED